MLVRLHAHAHKIVTVKPVLSWGSQEIVPIYILNGIHRPTYALYTNIVTSVTQCTLAEMVGQGRI